MKKILLIIVTLLLILLLCSCSNNSQNQTNPSITVPNVVGTDIDTAKNVVSAAGLVPKIEYEYDENIEYGLVIRIENDNNLKIGDAITLVVSNGASEYKSKEAQFTANHTNFQDLQIRKAYIKENDFYIELNGAVFVNAVGWYDRYNEGKGMGDAKINDEYDKTVPIEIINTPMQWSEDEAIDFTLKIPIGDLNTHKPTDLSVELTAIDVEGNQEQIPISFTFTW